VTILCRWGGEAKLEEGLTGVAKQQLARTEEWVTSGAVRYRPIASTGLFTGVEIGIDYAKAPVPKHFYFADYLSVDEDALQVMFTFGKLDKPHTDRLRSKVEVYFNPVMFVKQFWVQTRQMQPQLDKYVQDHNLKVLEQVPLLEAPKVQTFQANNVSILMTEGESMMDFFYLSPKDLFYNTQKREKIDVEALVRILLSPSQLLLMLTESQPIAERLLPKYGDKK
jgi:hypothetical protein